jgi:2-polyprenyl-3-methyl-5-hydroxy-6-metoxy-1,4-benzoquinol methylase
VSPRLALPKLGARDTRLVELMDDPACDPRRLAATYRRFRVVNRLVSGWGTVWRRALAPHLAGLGRPARVLDLGSGGGDLVVRLAALARRDGVEVAFTGADPDPRALAVARDFAGADRRFVCADASSLRTAGEQYDAVVSNHVLHHLDAQAPASAPTSLAAFADDALALSSGPVLHGDIARGRLAYALYGIGITPFAPGTFLRTDGLRSIRRSFTRAELSDVLGPRWRVIEPAPFRLLAIGRGHA